MRAEYEQVERVKSCEYVYMCVCVSETLTLVRCGGRQDGGIEFFYFCDALINLVNAGTDIFNLKDTKAYTQTHTDQARSTFI